MFDPPFSDYPICLYQCVGKESQLNCQGVRGRVNVPAVGEWILGEDETTNDVIVEPEYAHWMVDSLLVEERDWSLPVKHVLITRCAFGKTLGRQGT